MNTKEMIAAMVDAGYVGKPWRQDTARDAVLGDPSRHEDAATKAASSKPNAAGSRRERRAIAMKFICDVRQVTDLADGETAPPEPDMGYELRSIAGRRL